MNKNIRITKAKRKSNEKEAWISGICLIIAAILGMFSFNVNIENKKLKKDYTEVLSENTNLISQTSVSQEAYDNLNSRYEILQSKNNDLQVRIFTMEGELSQYSSLIEENGILKREIENLKEELDTLKNDLEIQESTIQRNLNAITESSDKKSLDESLPIRNDEILNKDTNKLIEITHSAKIRSGAGTDNPIISSAFIGEKFKLVDTIEDENRTEWYQIIFNEKTGFVRSDLAKKIQ